MHKPRRRIIAVILSFFIVLCCALPAFSLGTAPIRTVRVGFYHTEGYHVVDEKGLRSGYGFDILQAMKMYANWTYEYIGYDKGWADMQQMLLDGDIDMVVSAVKTPARMETYDFSDRPIGQSGACLLVKAGVSTYIAGQYSNYNGMRVGFIENASHIGSMEAFAQEKGFSYTPVYYKTSSELEEAIRSSTDVDAIVTSNMRIITGTRRLELFDMKDIHVMVKKGNAALLSEVNYALEQISLYNPSLYDSLFNKYYSLSTGAEVFFDPAEREFISECKQNGSVLRMALVPDISPYAFFEDGKPSGILYDITAEIIKRSRLDSELIVVNSDAAYRALIENKGVDLLLAARLDYNYAEDLGYTLISPYYNTDVSRVTRKGHEGKIESIAAVRNSTIDTHYLPAIVQNEMVFYYDNVDECIKAVLAGKCDSLYLLTRTAQEAVYNDDTNRLTSVIMPKFNVSFTIGVREDADARLTSILEKAASSLNDEDINALVLKYTDYTAQPLTLLGLLYSNSLIIMAIVVLLLGVAFAGIMIVFIGRKRKHEQEKNMQLQEALASAEQANSAKSIFLSRMSHEIRTPLNAIIGYNSICSSKLAEAKTESDYKQAAMQAMDCMTKSDIASKHLLTVINDVLDMSAIESGKIKIFHEPFDFKNLISTLTIMFYSQARARGIDFEVVLDTLTEEWFVGDQMRINQVFTNLLSNAIKFTYAGGHIKMTVYEQVTEEDTAHIRFEVQDSGIGMSKEFLENIWEPFEQADASISRRFGGTGLGLTITKNLVDLMGGAIQVESDPDIGTTFIVDFALERMKQPSTKHVGDYSNVNVLVADDDASTCDYIKLLFNRAGAKCATVNSGEAAITAVSAAIEKDEPYTVCIIDWYMPGSDGLTTVKRIREIAGPSIPIIVISAYDFSGIEASAKDAGINSFVAKPLFQSTVYNLLLNISGKSSASIDTSAAKYDFGGARVMLAEDNRMNLEIARAILYSWNLTVDEAWNGKEAVDMFCAAPPGTYKAILMDVHMPELDGYSASQAIRKSAHTDAASIPIIAMTADVFAEDVAQAKAFGMNDHIGKPIENRLLLATLRKYITLE